ncbi:hypothetical protein NQ318_007657 [Aromia moschata]|uniref:Major facilitator superfamily (MFS) profile domain-containing protein n=1 Tax=Aromia moschata TaxID=1265417 RepID=A0AAV8XW11_9CUCU|nr:hypothetical protein NQ318_007657 [Aromia moschata]
MKFLRSFSESFNEVMGILSVKLSLINGPYAATTAYLTEFHSSRYRARAQLALGMFMSLANVVLPLMAWGVLPREINQRVIGRFDFHSWNAFLLICASAPILSGVAFIFIPESPKFLMSAGRNQEALEVFKKVYKINTGKRLETYPIECLMEEKKTIALSLHMMFGRIGIVVGNVLFPFLLYAGCAPPFMFIGALCIGCACLSFLYPNTENKALE